MQCTHVKNSDEIEFKFSKQELQNFLKEDKDTKNDFLCMIKKCVKHPLIEKLNISDKELNLIKQLTNRINYDLLLDCLFDSFKLTQLEAEDLIKEAKLIEE